MVKTKEEKWILIFIPILFVLSALFHIIYNLTGKCIIAGLFSAVNESIWEHCKIVVFPSILFWSGFYFFNGKALSINKNKWFTAALASVLTAMITVPLLFYFYTQAFGVEFLWIDISIAFLAVLFGQLSGLHFYRYADGIKSVISISIIIGIIILFAVFTIVTPELPIFMDSTNGTYGVEKC